MKKNLLIRSFSILFVGIAVLFSCTKDIEDVRLDPTLETAEEVLGLTSNSATVMGFVVASGSGLTERGVVYSQEPNPTVDNNKVVYQGDTESAAFQVTITGLDYVTKYYVRAYAVSQSGVIYGNEFSFTTLPAIPLVSTKDVTDIAGTTAKTGGEVTDEGGAEVTERGVVYSTSENPTISDGKVVSGEGAGEFESEISGLLGSTTYYVRAYATSVAGTGYGDQKQFTTLETFLPTVTTAEVTNVAIATATSGGEVTADGGAPVTERGVVYGTEPNPTIDDSKVVSGDGVGAFVSNLTGLDGLTTYYLRAFATNSAGTAYGQEREFTTLAPLYPENMYVTGAATAYGWATPSSNAEAVMHRLAGGSSNEGIYWKIFHLQGGQGWKISAANWQSPNLNYGDVNEWDTEGIAVTPASNPNDWMIAESGMYIVVLNLRDNTTKVSVRPAAVHGIGEAFGGWGSDPVPFIVNNAAKTIVSPPLPTSGNIRMYAPHPWIPDWWNAEFRVFEGKIEYRGAGGDQGAVPGTTDQVITLNFDNNTGSIN